MNIGALLLRRGIAPAAHAPLSRYAAAASFAGHVGNRSNTTFAPLAGLFATQAHGKRSGKDKRVSNLENVRPRKKKGKAKPTPVPNVEKGVIPMRGAPIPKIPQRHDDIKTPSAFLEAIGRNEHDKFKVEEDVSWEKFFSYNGVDLKIAGVAIKDRRYILWCMQQFRRGRQPDVFRHDLVKKKVRGHGPAVQKGKLLRSKRHKMPKKEQLKMTMHGPIPPPNLVAKQKRAALERKQAEKEARLAKQRS